MSDTATRLAAVTTDRFVATDNGNFWFVADTHALDRNGTARVKDKAAAKQWTEDVLASEIAWEGLYSLDHTEGSTPDGDFFVKKLSYDRWEITRPNYPKMKPVVADSARTAQLYVRERKLWWVDQTTNLGEGSRVTMTDPETGRLRTEIVVQYIAWMDNSDEIVGHLGGRKMLSYPSGDACF
ncbi:hypothetical protein [Rhodococcus sp. 11-3]|uniref:hypothetical protein n=1 Tax=Rhodococcus sp. 11-3 TaxID=2854796 RepID=UPI0020402CE5|nr:hypothetical protein [Rhodococcus sp. 11-3]USC17068.1 hypothetical protein KZJ41_09450 [Rhodococcus sp. 11-3]